MKTVTDVRAEHALAHLAQRFDHWRQRRTTPRPRIPQPLWDQAVSFTAVLPVSRGAKRLGLSTNALKKPCAATPVLRSAEALPAALGFVEVTTASAWPTPTPRTESELQRAAGARLRMHAHELPLASAVLVRTFLETASCASSLRNVASFWPPSPSIAAQAWMGWQPCADAYSVTIPAVEPSMSSATARGPHAKSCCTTGRDAGSVRSASPRAVAPGGPAPRRQAPACLHASWPSCSGMATRSRQAWQRMGENWPQGGRGWLGRSTAAMPPGGAKLPCGFPAMRPETPAHAPRLGDRWQSGWSATWQWRHGAPWRTTDYSCVVEWPASRPAPPCCCLWGPLGQPETVSGAPNGTADTGTLSPSGSWVPLAGPRTAVPASP